MKTLMEATLSLEKDHVMNYRELRWMLVLGATENTYRGLQKILRFDFISS